MEPAQEPESNELEAIESDFQPQKEAPPAKCEGLKRAKIAAGTNFAWPVDGVVVAAFGKREGTPHDGIDIAAPRGTPIYASKTGEVLYSGERPGYGHMVILGHDGGMVTIYAHNEQNCVAQGGKVEQGEVIALVGRSGGATSPAVHFEVRLENKPVNPRAHLPK